MNIPPGVKHRQFYDACKAKGITVSSRYLGVHLEVLQRGYKYWRAAITSGGKYIMSKNFPFTEKGELAAKQHYDRCKLAHKTKANDRSNTLH